MRKSNRLISGVIIVGIVCAFIISVFVVFADRASLSFDAFLRREVTSHRIAEKNTSWRYLNKGEEPAIGNAWTLLSYDDSFWELGDGAFDFSRESRGEKNGTCFFRMEFDYNSRDYKAERLLGKIAYMDAIVMYLNGQIIYAGNAPDGGYASNLDDGAAELIDSIREVDLDISDLDALKNGRNVLAVEVHQSQFTNPHSYFRCDYLDITSEEREEVIPNTDSVIIKRGASEEVCITYASKEDAYYQVKYVPDEKHLKEEDFYRAADSVLMERHYVPEEGIFIHKATLKKLSTNQRYQYSICRIGSKKGSAREKFTALGRSRQLFGMISPYVKDEEVAEFLGSDMQILIPSWNDRADTSKLKNNIVIPAPGIWSDEEHKESYYRIRFGDPTENEVTDAYFLNGDVLVFSLNANIEDIQYHKDYMQKVIDSTQRKWIITMMMPSVLSGGKILDPDKKKEWIDLMQSMGVNVLVTSEGVFEYDCTEIGIINLDSISGEEFAIIDVANDRIAVSLLKNGTPEEQIILGK